MYKKTFFLINDEVVDACMHCGGPALIKYCRKYNGFRGKCTSCDCSWPES